MSVDLPIDFDFDAFEEEVYEAARVVFAKLQRDRSDETFYTFNFVTGDVMQHVYIFVNTEEELERKTQQELRLHDRYLDVPYDDLRAYLRYMPWIQILIDERSDSVFAKHFEKPNELLWSLRSQIEDLEDEILEDEEVDEDDYYDAVYENIDEPITARLMNVLRRLDNKGAFLITNKRENIHLGVIQSKWDYDMLPGPFFDINPPESCRRYEQDAKIFQRVQSTL